MSHPHPNTSNSHPTHYPLRCLIATPSEIDNTTQNRPQFRRGTRRPQATHPITIARFPLAAHSRLVVRLWRNCRRPRHTPTIWTRGMVFQTRGRIRGVKMMMVVLPLTDTDNKNQEQDKIFAEISQLRLGDNQ